MEVSSLVSQSDSLTDHDFKQFCQNWIWRAVKCLVAASDFEASPKWAAKRLNVSVDKIVEAFEGLERLGHIKRVGGTYETVEGFTDTNSAHLTTDDMIKIHSKLAPQIISKLKHDSKYTTQIFQGNSELVREYAPKFKRLLDEMIEKGMSSRTSEVTAIELSFASLTEGGGK